MPEQAKGVKQMRNLTQQEIDQAEWNCHLNHFEKLMARTQEEEQADNLRLVSENERILNELLNKDLK